VRKCRLQRLVLAAAVVGAVGLLSLPWYADRDANAERDSAISQVDWVNVDETNPWPPGSSPSESPSYDGDGTADPEDGDGADDGDGHDGNGPSGDGASPESGPAGAGGGSDGLFGLAFPVQAGLSVGLLALAFLALLPGRRMPADLR
jgi:hypothetical protein